MPQYSKRYHYLSELEQKIKKRRHDSDLCFLLSDESSFEDLVDEQYEKQYEDKKRKRFLFRKQRYRKHKKFDELDCLSFDSQNFNDTEFLHLF